MLRSREDGYVGQKALDSTLRNSRSVQVGAARGCILIHVGIPNGHSILQKVVRPLYERLQERSKVNLSWIIYHATAPCKPKALDTCLSSRSLFTGVPASRHQTAYRTHRVQACAVNISLVPKQMCIYIML